MLIKNHANTTNITKRDVLNISTLSILAIFIGIYLIATTSLIAKDGVTFILYAQGLQNSFIKTVSSEFQHPGYPCLILFAHKIVNFIHKDSSILSWIYSAQAVALISRILSVIVLYFIGKQLTNRRNSYLAVLIFILLPYPAEYGSDALSDWPHLFFFLTGFWFLLTADFEKKWVFFGFAGICAGLGYLIRPECALLVILGCCGLAAEIFKPDRLLCKSKILLAFLVLIIGFSVFAAPYMKLKGSLLPKKSFGISLEADKNESIPLTQVYPDKQIILCSAGYFKPVLGLIRLLQNIGEMTMWFFLPALFIGLFNFFKKPLKNSMHFSITALVILYSAILVLLYSKYGYISNRHTLPLLAITILFVPEGLGLLSHFINKNFAKKASFNKLTANNKLFFTILLIIGITICLPKLLRPIRIDKRGYREAAEWLKANTKSEDIIAVPDKRISFYAERQIHVYKGEKLPPNAEYIVMISKNRKDKTTLISMSCKLEYEYIDKKGRNGSIIAIYEL